MPPGGRSSNGAVSRQSGQRAISIRTVLSRHRWAVGLMESRTSPSPATLRHHSTPAESSAIAQAMLARFPADEYPHLAELTLGHVLRAGYDYGNEYGFGLDLILDGLERACKAA